MKRLELFAVFLLFLLHYNAYCLVDYSGEPPQSAPPEVKSPKMGKIVQKAAPQTAQRSAGPSYLSLGSSFHSVNVPTPAGEAKVGFLKLDAAINTPYNIFFEFSQWYGQSDSDQIVNEVGGQKGNPKGIIGFNWIKFGDRSEEASVDLYGGVQFTSKSQLARSVNDKIFGIRSAKRFYQFILEIGHEGILTGKDVGEQELAIGNMGHLFATIGWMATTDIHFALKGGTISIAHARDDGGLANKEKFGYISPALSLILSPYMGLDLGATFRSRRAKQDLIGARLWDVPGAYGSSLWLKLNVNI